jgi:hypothetical protein
MVFVVIGRKTHAKNLGYSQVSWDNFQNVSSFSTELGDLNSKKKAAVCFLFRGVWPPAYAGDPGLVSINYTKCNAKVGLFVYDNNIRYLLIRSTGAGQWDAIRMKENKAKKEVECPFCKSWKNVQGTHRHIGEVPLKPVFLNMRVSFERAAEVRDSPKFFKILRILIKYYHIIMTMGMY